VSELKRGVETMKRKGGLITSRIEFQITEVNGVNTPERWKKVVS
jgi:hypothetical protein